MASDQFTSGAGMTRREWIASAAAGIAAMSARSTRLDALESAPQAGNRHATGREAADHVTADRVTEDFDADWQFAQGDFTGAEQAAWDDQAWKRVRLPHDWSIEGTMDADATTGGPGGYMPTGIGWYRKRFQVAADDHGRRFTIFFDGVYERSTVWINGHRLGERPYGFVPFHYELTEYLNYGGENVIAVRVDNSQQPNCRWYSGSGINRHTWLMRTDALRIEPWGVFARTETVDGSAATVRVRVSVGNSDTRARMFRIHGTLVDGSEQAVANVERAMTLRAGQTATAELELTLTQATLWSPENPHLYMLRWEIREGDAVVDSTAMPFGIRQARFDAEQGFLLNGERMKLKGVCLHPDGGCVGTAVPERVWERRLELLKAMGCNAIRTSHNPFATEFLDLCDRMGFLVMAEAFDEWHVPKEQIRYGYSRYFDEWHERDLRNFIRRDRNHASIVIWSAGNEIGDQSAADGVKTLLNLKRLIGEEDGTRPVTAACDRIASEPLSNRVRPEFLEALDVVGYNYVDRWRERAQLYYSIDKAAFPRRRFVGTESIGIGGIRGEYGYLFGAPQVAAGMHFLPQQNLIVDTESLWKFVRAYNYVAGDFMWTGVDYLGEAEWPMRGSTFGAMDTCGFPKDAFYFYQSQWSEQPMVHLSPHWNWKGREGETIPVTCFTNCDTVELFANGRSMGMKGYEFPREGMEGRYGNYPARAKRLRTTSDLHLSWDVRYEPGVLKAVGYRNGVVAVTQELATTGPAVRVQLTADREDLRADGRDVAHVTAIVVDAEGRVVPTASDLLHVDVEGDGELIGVDNGDPYSHQRFKGRTQTAFHGMCLGIVQTTQKAGVIRLRASAEGLQEAAITLRTK